LKDQKGNDQELNNDYDKELEFSDDEKEFHYKRVQAKKK